MSRPVDAEQPGPPLIHIITSLRNQVREREVRYDDLLERCVALLERNEALLEALYNSSDVSFPY